MHLITDEGLSLLLKRLRNKIALKSALENKVDKVNGKDLSDNDFTNSHIELLSNSFDSVSVEHSTGKSHITFLNSEINNNIKLDIDTGCDLFFYPVLSNVCIELDGTITIPYTYISKEGCDIGKISVTMSYIYEEDIDPTTQIFEINSKESGELVLTNIPEKTGWVKYSFTILGDTDAIKTNFMEYEEILIKVFASYRTSERDMLPGTWYSAGKVISEDLKDGTYKTTVYSQGGNTSITFANNKKIFEIYHISNHVTNMYNTFNNCTNLTGNPFCSDKVTNMYSTYYNCKNLTGSPVCGNNVTDMSSTYYNCYNLTGSPVCGPNVTKMISTYYNCQNLKGSPVIGDNVVNASSAYMYCTNLTGQPVCGPNVTNMCRAYDYCYNITGSPACGDKVIDMYEAYSNCYNLTGSPVCGPNVTNMNYAYNNCYNLTGSPVCGDNVIYMDYAYYNCHNLTGNPACGPNVTKMNSTYGNCTNLTGSPACGDNVIYMIRTYNNCTNLTGSPVCGPLVTNMMNTYYCCYNLTGQPACGNNVTDMSNAYMACFNLTGSPACGPNVNDMSGAYYNCRNLTGSPVCGDNVTSMSGTYVNCYNLTGSPVCGPNVTNMSSAYYNCKNLTGSPVCGDNVTSMYCTYRDCYNLTGSAACGPNVTGMYETYMNCYNLTGQPACGNNVTNMYHTYSYCYNLTGSPVCGDKVTNMDYTYYDCRNLTGQPACGNNVTDMSYAYYNCYSLTGAAVCGDKVTRMLNAYYNCKNLTSAEIGPRVTNTDNCFVSCSNLVSVNISNGASTIGNSAFWGCSKIERIVFPSSITLIRSNAFNGCSNLISYDFRNHKTIPTLNNTSAFYNINSQCIITVPVTLYGDWIVASNWSSYANYILPDTTEPGIISIENDTVNLDVNKTRTIDITIVNFEDVNSINVSAVSDKTACVSIGNITKVQKNSKSAVITVELITTELEEDANITLTVSSASATVNYTFVVEVEKVTIDYTVEPVSGASYGFELNADGYYESKNKGVQSSYAICKINIVNPNKDHKVILDCISYGESNYDYGILSNVGSTLTSSSSADSSGVKKSFYGLSSSAIQSVNYGAVEGTIYVKYIKDGSQNSGNDTLQFKVRFEYIDPNAPSGSFTVEPVSGASYGFALNGDYYENQNKQQDNTAALCKVIINNPLGQNVVFYCDQSSESGYDYGLLSNVGSTLATSNTADSSGVKQSCKSKSGSFIVNYGAIEGTIYVKYRKDGSVSNGTDTFKFKVEFE